MASAQVRGLEELVRSFRDMHQRQLPFAGAKGLTDTARQVQAAETRHISEAFDRPTPFTRRAVGYTPANKQNLTTTIFVRDAQAKYLIPQAVGGRRDFKPFEEKFALSESPKVALPARAAKLNAYGNISKAQILRIARDVNSSGNAKRFFKGVPRGAKHPDGIYARVNNNTRIEPVMVFATEAVYEKRFEFSEIARLTIDQRLVPNLKAAWEYALASARK